MRKIFSCILILVLLFSMVSYSEEVVQPVKDAKIHFINVGQADSIFIDYEDYDILIDGGNNADGDLVVNYLKSLNVDDIEILICTHAHEDHVGGLDNVISAFNIENIISPENIENVNQDNISITYKDYINAAINEKKTINCNLLEDSDLTFNLANGIDFKVLEMGDGFSNENNNSVVCTLDYNDTELLFMGDLESDVEKQNLNKFSDIEVLKLGHHGSKTSTCKEFLEITKPEYGIISCGVDNKYGHPNDETLVKLNEYKVKAFRTDQQGNIICITDGSNITFNTNPTQITVDGNVSNQDNTPNTTTQQSNTKIEKTYVGSNKSNKYHLPSCRWAKKIKPENQVIFSSKEDAESKGYESCGTCNP